MFAGHFAAGYGAKKVDPRISLGTLFLAAQFVDLLWPTLLMLGWERVAIEPGATAVTPLVFEHYPISHSLLGVLGWGLLLGGLYGWWHRTLRGALLVGGLVVSHWVLDLLVHQPDLPILPGTGPEVGFGLWHSVTGTLVVEGLLFGIGLRLYRRATRPLDRVGRYGFWGLAGFIAAVYLASVYGPPPESVGAIAGVGQMQWILVGLAYWVDAHREPVP